MHDEHPWQALSGIEPKDTVLVAQPALQKILMPFDAACLIKFAVIEICASKANDALTSFLSMALK